MFRRAATALGWDADAIEVAVSFVDRLLGMTARPPLTPDGALRILAFPSCRAVHTCFMRYPLDVAFIDGAGAVLVVHEGVAPWRFISHPAAAAVIERPSCAEGSLRSCLRAPSLAMR